MMPSVVACALNGSAGPFDRYGKLPLPVALAAAQTSSQIREQVIGPETRCRQHGLGQQFGSAAGALDEHEIAGVKVRYARARRGQHGRIVDPAPLIASCHR
jgi:hypothetical protein